MLFMGEKFQLLWENWLRKFCFGYIYSNTSSNFVFSQTTDIFISIFLMSDIGNSVSLFQIELHESFSKLHDCKHILSDNKALYY